MNDDPSLALPASPVPRAVTPSALTPRQHAHGHDLHYEGHDDLHDLDVGVGTGRARVDIVTSSTVLPSLCNTLDLGDDDQVSLTAFLRPLVEQYEQGLVEGRILPTLSEDALVWTATRAAHSRWYARKTSVVWLPAHEVKNAVEVAALLDVLVSEEEETRTSGSELRAAAQARVGVFATPRGARQSFAEKKKNKELHPIHVLVVLVNICNDALLYELVDMPQDFQFLALAAPQCREPLVFELDKTPVMVRARTVTGVEEMAPVPWSIVDPATVQLTAVPAVDVPVAAAEAAEEVVEEAQRVPDLHIIHFNDVYHIHSTRKKDPVGGAPRFQSVLKNYAHKKPLVLFSGDAFSPSIMSTVTKGSHMPPVLNEFGISCACLGNHDLDFGVDVAARLVEGTNFPWVMSNVLDSATRRPLANSLRSKLLEWEGMNIGIVAVAEKEWIDTLPQLDPASLIFLDFVETAREMARELRAQGAVLVIALTHMREPNDLVLAREVEEIDLVLGGHDHFYNVTHIKENGGITVVKSGTDFRELSYIEVFLAKPGEDTSSLPASVNAGRRAHVAVQHIEVTRDIEPDPEMAKMVEELSGEVNAKMSEVVGEVHTELDARFSTVRAQESNVGNLMGDIIRRVYNVDVAFLCGGTVRSNDTYGPGDITLSDVLSLFPFEDACMVLRVTGDVLLRGLENGVSMVPKLEGRFPQLSGMSFVYDPDAEPEHRVLFAWVNGEKLEPAKQYTMATRGFLAEGHDGFDMFPEGDVLVDDENGHMPSVLLRNFFWKIAVINRMRRRQWKKAYIESAVTSYNVADFALNYLDDSTRPVYLAPEVEHRIVTKQQYIDLVGEQAAAAGDIDPHSLYDRKHINLPEELDSSIAAIEERPPMLERRATGLGVDSLGEPIPDLTVMSPMEEDDDGEDEE